MEKTLLAHVREDQKTGWHIHSLAEHLEGVSELAAMFAGRFGLEKLSSIQGLVHDAGKASDDFQQKIAGKSGYNPDAHTNKAPWRTPKRI